MSNLGVRDTLIASMFALEINYPVMYPNGLFYTKNTPSAQPKNSPWVRATILNQDDTFGTLGVGGLDRVDGIMQLDVFVPKGGGDRVALTIIEELKAVFKRGAALSGASGQVRILSASVAQGDEEEFYSQHLDVVFRSYFKR